MPAVICGKYHYTKKLKNVGVTFTVKPIWVATPKHMLEVVNSAASWQHKPKGTGNHSSNKKATHV